MDGTAPKRTAQPNSEELATLFGPPPLYEGDEILLYYEWLSRISSAIKPADILEHIWIRDGVDERWEVMRLRRIKANLLNANAYHGLKEVLAPLVDRPELEDLCNAWAARKPNAVETVTKLLASAGLSIDHVMAQTLAVMLDKVGPLDDMIANAEARYTATLREIDRHRETLGQKIRRAVQQAEEGELRVIESAPINGANQ